MSGWRRANVTGTLSFIGWNPDREITLETQARDSIELVFGGLAGETHSGVTRPSCSRVKNIYPDKGTEIANMRQLSVLSTEEIADITAAMGIDQLKPEWLGANIVISGIPHLTLLPPGSRLRFPSGASLHLDVENGPCVYPAEIIAQTYPQEAKLFIKSATGRRGTTAGVERPGIVKVGDQVELFVPDQPAYPGEL